MITYTDLKWIVGPIDDHVDSIKELFCTRKNHNLSSNYVKSPLLEYTKFACMGYYGDRLVYYSAAIERPEYNGSIRVCSRHFRAEDIYFATQQESIKNFYSVLNLLVEFALMSGYENIWISRYKKHFLNSCIKYSRFEWESTYETMHNGCQHHVIRLANQRPVFDLNLDINEDLVMLEIESKLDDADDYIDGRSGTRVDGWKIIKDDLPIANKIAEQFPFKVSPRYYVQYPGVELPKHVDNGTQCSINILIGEDNQPITYEKFGDILYKHALVDTTKQHSVKASDQTRYLLKLSVFDYSFEEAKQRISPSLSKRS